MSIGRFHAVIGALVWCASMLLPEGHWLLKVIQRAEAMRARMPRELLAYYRAEGWAA